LKQTLTNWCNTMIKIANNVHTMLLKQAARLKAEDVPFGDPNHPGHVVADYLYGVPGLMPLYGHAHVRNNISQVLAEAAGIPSEDVSWTVKYPMLSMLAGTLGGASIGGPAGYGIGAGLGDKHLGAIIGAAGGALGGGLLTTLARRKAIKAIAEEFNTAKKLKKLEPENLGYFGSVAKALHSPVHPALRDGIIEQTAGFTKKPD